MDSAGTIIAVILVAITLLAGAGVVHYSLSNTGAQTTYTESFTPTSGDTITFNESERDDVYYDTAVNVTGENDAVMQQGVDYNWHQSNGTLTVISGGDLEDDSSANIEYGLRVPSDQQRTYASMLGGWITATYALPLVLAVALVVLGLGVLANLTS